MTRIIGLTGGIASGKSAVASILRRLDVPVVDADDIARRIAEPGSDVLERIRAEFGDRVLDADGRLDRPALARIVFSDPVRRRRLEAITHPAIVARSAELLSDHVQHGHAVVVYEAPLLVETGRYRDFALLIVVTARPETQLARLMARDGLDEAEARDRLAAQLPMEDKVAVADLVIDNDGDLESLERAVRLAMDEGA